MAEVIIPQPGPAGGTTDKTKDTVIVNNEVIDNNAPRHGTEEPGGIHLHPMSCEAKHVTVAALIFLIIGLFVGYWEKERKGAAGSWGVVFGFGIGGLLLGIAIGCAMPARKRHKHLCADGTTTYSYTD